MRPISALLCLLFTLGAGAQPPAPANPVPSTGRISGQIVSTTGAPIPKATLRLIQNGPLPAGTQSSTFVEISGSDGSFAFEALPAGRFNLSAQKPGFSNAPASQQTAYVLASGENKSNVRFMLMPLGTISGHVLDRDGDPVANVQIQVMRYAFQQGRTRLQLQNSSNTDDRGQFRITNLQPGRYYIRADDVSTRFSNGLNEHRGPSARESNLATFYPASPDLNGAVKLDVQSGAEVAGVDVRMLRGQNFSFKGKVLDDSGAPMQAQLTLIDRNSDTLSNIGGPGASSQLPDGLFQFGAVPPGDYILTARGNVIIKQALSSLPVFDVNQSAAQLIARQAELSRASTAPSVLFGRFEISVRADMANVILRLAPGGTVTGHISLEGGGKLGNPNQPVITLNTQSGTSPQGAQGPPPPRPLQFIIVDVDGNGGAMTGVVQPDGSFSISNVVPSRYALNNVAQLSPQSYLKSVRMGGQDVGDQYLDFRNGASGPLDIVLGNKPGMVSGAARDAKGDAASNVFISIWPKTPRLADQSGSARVFRPANGTFTNQSLAPGDYYIAAWEDVDQQLLQNTDFLSKFTGSATAFKVEEGVNQTVEPKWIGKEAAAKIADRFPE